MDGACGMYGEEKRCLQGFSSETRGKETTLES